MSKEDYEKQIRSLTLSLQQYISEGNHLKLEHRSLQIAYKTLDQKHFEVTEAYKKCKGELDKITRVLKFTNEHLAFVEEET